MVHFLHFSGILIFVLFYEKFGISLARKKYKIKTSLSTVGRPQLQRIMA